jgi:type IV pilus assembly protein PilE
MDRARVEGVSPPRRQAGITLIELMIVVVIVAILGALAVPSYRDYVLRNNRTDAITQLLELAACQEKVYIKLNRYDGNRCGFNGGAIATPNGTYSITMAVQDGGQAFTLTATAQGKQTDDSCANLTLTDNGERGTSVSDVDATVAACWKGKKIS